VPEARKMSDGRDTLAGVRHGNGEAWCERCGLLSGSMGADN
jgi:hypothetical protein